MQDKNIDLDVLLDEFEDGIDNNDNEEYLAIQKVYEEKFGHIPERLLMPPIITEEQIKNAMLKCLETGEDNLGEILNIGNEFQTSFNKNKLF